MGLKSLTISVKGITPLIMHAYPLVTIKGLEKKTPEEQAEHAAYRVPSSNGQRGELYIPGANVQRGLIEAATYSKGKGRASLLKPAAACLMVTPERILLAQTDYGIDSRWVVIPSTGGRVLRHRPRLETWECTFTVEYDDTLLKETEVRTIVEDWCNRVGVLDYRPECKGPFGRSMIVNWAAL